MEQFKRAKVIILPTGESNLSINRSYKERGIGVEVGKPYLTYCKTFKYYSSVTDNSCNPQHLYIISNDEIKEGDWVTDGTEIWKAEKGYSNQERIKKIIATTDTSLKTTIAPYIFPEGGVCASKDFYLPQLSQQFIKKFIEEYNKGNIITDVLVEYKTLYSPDNIHWCSQLNNNWEQGCSKIILNINQDNTINIQLPKNSWNREEVIELCNKAANLMVEKLGQVSLPNWWIEKNL